jgi:hypothetical protein
MINPQGENTTPPDRGQSRPSPNAAGDREGVVHKVSCGDIQELLLDYMTRELGGARGDLVREHLRKCPRCQTAAAEIQATLDLLHRASTSDAGIPLRLSDDHRARITRALMHPVIDWIERHHILVSVWVAALILAALLAVLLRIRIERQEQAGPGIPVTIGREEQAEKGEVEP